MAIQQLASGATKEILAAIGGGDDKSAEISRIVEKALVSAIRETQSKCLDAVTVCCSPDNDLAHKISSELKRQQSALIANLSSMR